MNPNSIEKVADLEGMDLDYWVAIAEGLKVVTVVERWGHVVELANGKQVGYAPSTEWYGGGPIIEREGLQLRKFTSWEAGYAIDVDNGEWVGPYGRGETQLVAAMRAYVASKFGETVNWNDPALP